MTKIRVLGNVGEYKPQLNNIFLGEITDASISSKNGRFIAFAVRGTQNNALDIAIQTPEFIQQQIAQNGASFPADIVDLLITFNEMQQLGLVEVRQGYENYSGTRLSLEAFTNIGNGILKVGYQAKALGTLLGEGIDNAEVENLINYDLNGDGAIGDIKKAIEDLKEGKNPAPSSFLPAGIQAWWDKFKVDYPTGSQVVYWGGLAIGANVVAKAVTGKPLVGKNGTLIKM